MRVGIASYGITPDPRMTFATALKPVMTLQARLSGVKRVSAGTSVSYGHTWTAERDTTLGLVPIGYGEGLPRSASNRAEVWVGGRRAAVAGTICMDQLVVELGETDARPGDRVTLFGAGLEGEPTADDWAAAAGTISYEVVTRLGGRLTRSYRGER